MIYSKENNPGASPDATYLAPPLIRCFQDGDTNNARPVAYTFPLGQSLSVAFIHNFRPSMRSTSAVHSSSLPGVASTFCANVTRLITSSNGQTSF